MKAVIISVSLTALVVGFSTVIVRDNSLKAGLDRCVLETKDEKVYISMTHKTTGEVQSVDVEEVAKAMKNQTVQYIASGYRKSKLLDQCYQKTFHF